MLGLAACSYSYSCYIDVSKDIDLGLHICDTRLCGISIDLSTSIYLYIHTYGEIDRLVETRRGRRQETYPSLFNSKRHSYTLMDGAGSGRDEEG